MRLVVIESPYGTRPDGTRCTWAEIERNTAYARAALLDCLQRGEAPLASHLLYTQVLDDENPSDRVLGMTAGAAYLPLVVRGVVYEDHGISRGMTAEIAQLQALGIPFEYRYIGG